jgi:long-chain acyl-CoA synthetase
MRWNEAGQRVRRIADGLLAEGIEAEQRCVILAETSVEWILADMAILCAGAATTTLYASATPAECEHVLTDCGAVVVFCDENQQDKLEVVLRDNRTVRRIIVFGESEPTDARAISLSAFEAVGRDHGAANPDAYATAGSAITPERLATLMYTSGTTGLPKGVRLSHDAWVYEAEAIDSLGFMNPADKQFLFLPLAHVFAKVMQVSFIRLGVPTVVDASIDALGDNLRETKPTWMAAVPRVFEKAHAAIHQEVSTLGPIRKAAFHWAVSIGQQAGGWRQQGKALPVALQAQYAIADRLVLAPIRERFGGRIRFFISGGAPLSPDIARFFHAVGLLVLEGYGLTESGAASCVNRLNNYRFGSVGPPIPGCEVRIAEDGEVLIRSRGVMQGYYNSVGATSIDADGWLYTGDIGTVLPGEHVMITGRKKDLIVTAGGKNIAPAQFESLLVSRCRYVSHAVMHGDRRPFCVVLVALDLASVATWARSNELAWTDDADLAARPEVRNLIQRYISEVNRDLPSFEQVKAFDLLPEAPSRENGLLTATLKVKRAEVARRWSDRLEALYA